MLFKVLHSICQQIWKTQQWPQDWERSIFIPVPKKSNAKKCSTTIQLHSFHMLARLFSKSFKLGFMNQEIPDVQAGFRKGRGTRDQIANVCWIIEKARELQKTSTFASLSTLKPLSVWITTNCGKFLKRWEYQTTSPVS